MGGSFGGGRGGGKGGGPLPGGLAGENSGGLLGLNEGTLKEKLLCFLCCTGLVTDALSALFVCWFGFCEFIRLGWVKRLRKKKEGKKIRKAAEPQTVPTNFGLTCSPSCPPSNSIYSVSKTRQITLL